MHLSGEQKHVVEAPEFWVFCVDYRRDAQLVAEADLGWTEQLVAGCLDAGICAQSAMAALEAEGLGGVFVGGLRNGIAEVDKLLQLPEHVVALLGLSFGYPAYKNELKPRLPQAVTVMENNYCEVNPETIADYDARMREYFAARSRNPHENPDETFVVRQKDEVKRDLEKFKVSNLSQSILGNTTPEICDNLCDKYGIYEENNQIKQMQVITTDNSQTGKTIAFAQAQRLKEGR